MLNIFYAAFITLLFSGTLVAGWSPPVTISEINSDSPQIKLDSSGTAKAIWKTFVGSNSVIQEAEGSISNEWTTPQNLSDPSQSANLPRIALDVAGNQVVVWSRFNGTYQVIQAITNLVGPPIDLSIPDNDAIFPAVASGPVNSAVAVWMKQSGSNFVIQAATKDAGGPWSSPVDLSSSLDNSITPKVAVDPFNNAIAVWVSFDGTHYIVQAARRPSGSSWSAAQNLSSPTVDALVPQIAMDSLGNATVVWQMNDGVNTTVQVVTYSSGVWSVPQNLSLTGDAVVPQIDVNSSNNAVVVWELQISSHSTVQAVTRVGGTWSSPVDLSTGVQNSVNPKVAIDAEGNAVVAWKQSIVAGSKIQAVVHPFNGSWSLPVDVSTEGQDAEIPEVAMSQRGDAIIAWRNNFLTQIQVSRGSFFVAPPSNFLLRIKKCQFLNKTEHILILSWQGSQSPNVAYYSIYKDNQLVENVLANSDFTLYFKINPKRASLNYTIIAYSSEGFPSTPLNGIIIRESLD